MRFGSAFTGELGAMAQQHDIARVEDGRDGGWHVEDTAGRWWRLHEGEQTSVTLLTDPGLRRSRGEIDRLLSQGVQLRVLAHRIGRRAVLDVQSGEDHWISKIYHKDRDIARRWQTARDGLTGAVSAPRVRAWKAEQRTLEIDFVGSACLHDTWRAGNSCASDGERLAEILAQVANIPVPDGLASHGRDAEIALLQRQLEVHTRLHTQAHPSRTPLVEQACRALEGVREQPPVFAHRDFHDKQVLTDDHCWHLIDWDLAAAVPPGLDAGNLLAHVQLRAIENADLDGDGIAANVLSNLPDSLRRDLAPFVCAALTRLVFVYERRCGRETTVEALIESAHHARERTREWKDLP